MGQHEHERPEWRGVLYVEESIGPETVSTLPLATLEAFRDHGSVRGATVLEGWNDAEQELGRRPGTSYYSLSAAANQAAISPDGF